MYNASQGARGIPNKSKYEQKYENFRYSSPKTATDMGVSSSESHDLPAFYEMLTASFGVLSQNTGLYPSLDRIVESTLGPLNLGPGGGSYNEPISRLQWLSNKLHISDTNHTLSSLSAHSATCFSHSRTSLGLQQSNTSLIKKGCQSISSLSILYIHQVLAQFLQHQPHCHLHQDLQASPSEL